MKTGFRHAHSFEIPLKVKYKFDYYMMIDRRLKGHDMLNYYVSMTNNDLIVIKKFEMSFSYE